MKNILIINPVSTEHFNKLTIDYLKGKKLEGIEYLPLILKTGPIP